MFLFICIVLCFPFTSCTTVYSEANVTALFLQMGAIDMLVIIWSQTDTFLYNFIKVLYLPRHSAPSNDSSMETVTRSLLICSVVYRLCCGTLHAASDMLPFLLHLHHLLSSFLWYTLCGFRYRHRHPW